MITFKPFKAVMPKPELAKDIAALPYDVFNREEAKKETITNPCSFLRIDRAETNFNDEIDIYSNEVYLKANSLLNEWIETEMLIEDSKNAYYLYELGTQTHTQTGFVGLTAVKDLVNGSIKDHEKTRADKLADRIKHIDVCNAHTGPILMFYQDNQILDNLILKIKQLSNPIIDFKSDDTIQHRIFRIIDPKHLEIIATEFEKLNALYIADGHHRASAAKSIALMRNNELNDLTKPENLFLSVVFPANQLKIMDYNRVIKDLNGLSGIEFLDLIQSEFDIIQTSIEKIKPEIKGQFSMYYNNLWYLLNYKYRDLLLNSPIDLLDVSIIQNKLLCPILGIQNPATDSRIDFIGGVKGLDALEKRVKEDCVVAFALVATSIEELIDISNSGQLMPPKSTWFEPKLRSGLFIHLIK